MNIEDRLIRRDPEDIIEIGNIMEACYGSPAGAVLRAIINGKVSREAKILMFSSTVSSDRALGRIEAWQDLIDSVEQAIMDKDALIKPIPEEER